jgi:hypothetical protein
MNLPVLLPVHPLTLLFSRGCTVLGLSKYVCMFGPGSVSSRLSNARSLTLCYVDVLQFRHRISCFCRAPLAMELRLRVERSAVYYQDKN